MQEAAMSATEVNSASRDAVVGQVGMHLEVMIIPMSDVDRSKEFYQRLGWRLDDDAAPLDGLRIVQFTPPGSGTPAVPAEARQPSPDPERTSYRSFCSFADPDGNTWLVQEVTTRLQGRIDAADTAYASAADLASALQRAEAAHVEHQKRTAQSHLLHRSGQDENWSAWYAACMAAEQAGTDMPA
jgi:catechol 2,3-dioxygenase-like lactoylglutathione lyase family enzyme